MTDYRTILLCIPEGGGQITAEPDVAGMTDSKWPTTFVLCINPIFEDGKIRGFQLGPYDYHFMRFKRPSGEVFYSACSRPIEDREWFPNWPKPEPPPSDRTREPFEVEKMERPSGVRWAVWDQDGQQYQVFRTEALATEQQNTSRAWREQHGNG
jgi:hypothetical protein